VDVNDWTVDVQFLDFGRQPSNRQRPFVQVELATSNVSQFYSLNINVIKFFIRQLKARVLFLCVVLLKVQTLILLLLGVGGSIPCIEPYISPVVMRKCMHSLKKNQTKKKTKKNIKLDVIS
jgi:hypothetical protein